MMMTKQELLRESVTYDIEHSPCSYCHRNGLNCNYYAEGGCRNDD